MNIIKLLIKTLLATVIIIKPMVANEIWRLKEKVNGHEVILFNYDKITKEDALNLIRLINNFNKNLKVACFSSFLSKNKENTKLEIIDFSARYRFLYEYNKGNIYQFLLPINLANIYEDKVVNPTSSQDITLLDFCIINIENYINKNIINKDLAIFFYISSNIFCCKNHEHGPLLNTFGIHIENKTINLMSDPIDALRKQLEVLKTFTFELKKSINEELSDWINNEQIKHNIIIFHSKEDTGLDIKLNDLWENIYKNKYETITAKEYKELLKPLINTNKMIPN